MHGAARLLDTWSDDGALTGDPIAFSATAQVFLGRGLGAEAGVLALANSDRFPAVVLASAGAYRTDAILHQQEPVELLATLQQTLADSTLDRFHPAVNLYQQFFDLADPVCSAEALVADTPLSRTPKHVLQVYGLWDDHTPEEAQQALQRALQIPTAGDVLVDFGQSTTTLPATSNLFTGSDYYTAASIQAGGGMDALLDPEILRQVEHFLATAVTEDVPTIPR